MRRLLWLLVVLAALSPARADLWTNQAGRVIEARLDACDGVWVTLVRTNGSPLKIPLSALCPADQRRARVQKALSVAPGFVKAAYKDAMTVMDRFERLPAEKQTPEGRQQAVSMARSVFDARLQARAPELTDKDVIEEVKRLRAALDTPTK
jgi:hypothetical protein